VYVPFCGLHGARNSTYFIGNTDKSDIIDNESRGAKTPKRQIHANYLVLMYEKLFHLWKESKDYIGMIFFIAFTMWTIVLVANTFQTISTKADHGNLSDSVVVGFYLSGFFIAGKLIAIANAAHAIKNRVSDNYIALNGIR
jgi:hypothetical protein